MYCPDRCGTNMWCSAGLGVEAACGIILDQMLKQHVVYCHNRCGGSMWCTAGLGVKTLCDLLTDSMYSIGIKKLSLLFGCIRNTLTRTTWKMISEWTMQSCSR